MARIRDWGGALSRFGQSLVQGAQADEANTARMKAAATAQSADVDKMLLPLVLSGQIDPGQLTPEMTSRLKSAYNVDPTKLTPSPEARVGGIVGSFDKANALNEVPTQEDIMAKLRGAGLLTPPNNGTGALDMMQSPSVKQALEARAAKEAFLRKQQGVQKFTTVDAQGNALEQALPATAEATSAAGLNDPHPVEASNEQAATRAEGTAKASAKGAGLGANDPEVVDAQLEKYRRETPLVVQRSNAEAAGRSKFQKQGTTTLFKDGRKAVFSVNADGSIGPEVQMPAGFTPDNPVRELSRAQQDRLVSINASETVGTGVLQMLKDSGLDKDNNPLSSRFDNFVATQLQMAQNSGDPEAQRIMAMRDKIQQNAAFVQANMLRSLFQGRPSTYLAALYQKHIPDGKATGQKLYQLLNDALAQGVIQRTDLLKINHQPEGNPDFLPESGTSYTEWLAKTKDAAPPGQGQPGGSIGALKGRP